MTTTTMTTTTISTGDAPTDAEPMGAPAAVDRAAPWDRMRSDLGLVVRQIGFEQRAFWRNRSRAVSSVALPMMFLVVFNALNGGHRIDELGGVTYATWFVPGILAYGVIMATFANLAVSTTIARDRGVLKRLRGTALPSWVYLAGSIGSAVITAGVLVAMTLGLGVLAYGVELRPATLPGLVATLVLGVVCCTALGLAVTAIIPRADAATAVVNLIVLPLTFISGIWMVLDGAPSWLTTFADLLPVHALADGLQRAVHPATAGPGLVAGDLAVLGVWAVIGLLAARRWFRWH